MRHVFSVRGGELVVPAIVDLPVDAFGDFTVGNVAGRRCGCGRGEPETRRASRASLSSPVALELADRPASTRLPWEAVRGLVRVPRDLGAVTG